MILQANSQDISHFIFEGLPGVGKRTMILALLRETFGADKIKVKNIQTTLQSSQLANYPRNFIALTCLTCKSITTIRVNHHKKAL